MFSTRADLDLEQLPSRGRSLMRIPRSQSPLALFVKNNSSILPSSFLCLGCETILFDVGYVGIGVV